MAGFVWLSIILINQCKDNYLIFDCSNNRMGSQCTCQRPMPSSEGYLSSSFKPSLPEQNNTQDMTDFEQEFDNPSRDILNNNFLQTSITASNNKLLLAKIDKLPNQCINSPPLDATQVSLINANCSEMSIGKNLDQSYSQQDILQEIMMNVKSPLSKNRKASIQQKIPLINFDVLQTKPVENAEQILRQISGYILSEKHLFEPIKIPKENFIRFKNEDIHKTYKFLQKLGEGSYGKVYKVQNKRTGDIRAAKVMKRQSISQQAHLKLMNQIDILRKVDHPNIIKIYEAYIFENVYCIITQFCQGGSLLRFIQKGRQFTDQSISIICRKLFSALSYIHKQNIIHRDIKLDNIVLVSKTETYGDLNSIDIRIIDFGLAKVLPTKRIKDKQKIGTFTHMAPQVLSGIYSTKCDVWSAGIALYSLVSGTTPFRKVTKQRTFQQILKGYLQFPGQIWRQANVYLKDLITILLTKNINQRITASAALNHYFLRSPKEADSQKKVFQKITKKFFEYHRGNNLLSMIESYISYTTITQKQLQGFSAMFQILDTNCDGVIQRKELQNAFSKSGHSFSKNQIDYVLGKIDKNHEGKINYSQFVTILSDRTKLHAKNSMIEAFKYIDTNNDGYLQKEQIKMALKSIDYKQLSSILMELDENNDNKISQEEFIKYLEEQRII